MTASHDFEDVPGAAAAERAIRARQYAALLLIAVYGGDAGLQSDVMFDYIRGGIRTDEIVAAKAELRRVYRLDDIAQVDAVAVLRRLLDPPVAESNPSDPHVEDYRVGTVEDCPDDGFEWPAEGDV